jgi:NADH-quinone oxidoreductase subunit N
VQTDMMRPLLLPEMLLVVRALTALLGGSFVP